MKDRDFLMWIHDRLTFMYKEKPLVDYMHKLRCIITTIPENQDTPNDGRGGNGMCDLIERLADMKKRGAS